MSKLEEAEKRILILKPASTNKTFSEDDFNSVGPNTKGQTEQKNRFYSTWLAGGIRWIRDRYPNTHLSYLLGI